MAIVIDASIAATWFLPDEFDARADKALGFLAEGAAQVPSLFWFEIRNILLKAERRNRLSPQMVRLAMQQLRALPIEDEGTGPDSLILDLAARHQLTAYDASYLALSLETGHPLTTADKALESAATQAGAAVFG